MPPKMPLLFNTEDSVFFQFGYDWQHKSYLFPALIKSITGTTLEATYATKIRLSVFDQRNEPSLGIWLDWSDDCSECGVGRIKERKRECICETQPCYDCEEHLIEVR